MPIYLDRHEPVAGVSVTPQELAQAHMADLDVQGRYGVQYITYWFDQDRQSIFCLVNAPSKELAEVVHKESHGLTASRILEVDPNVVQNFLGSLEEPPPGEPRAESAFRTILFTDIEGSTALTQRLGDEVAMDLLRRHDAVVGDAIDGFDGKSIKHTGDGVMAAFSSVVQAVHAAAEIQRQLAAVNEAAGGHHIRVRIGLAAGEPVTEKGDLFGAAVQLAARVCAHCEPDSILASSAVRDLSIGKGFAWRPLGEVDLKGFEEPVRVYELDWREAPQDPVG
jgi:class 3 adenylate cyclase